ncbi:MAG TPA: hypothetical protein VGI71_05960 [Scandinavium sp.]|jgi:hypothetical protein
MLKPIAIAIDKYPTPTSSMNYQIESKLTSTEATVSVCSTDTRPSGGTTVKRIFRWNVMGMTLYVKKPMLGVERTPATIVATNYACLYFGSGSCSISSATQVSNIWLSGFISAPLSCTINDGGTIDVEMAPTRAR